MKEAKVKKPITYKSMIQVLNNDGNNGVTSYVKLLLKLLRCCDLFPKPN